VSYNAYLLEEFVGSVSNLGSIIEKINGVAAKSVAAMRAVGEHIPNTYFTPSYGEPALVEMEQYLRAMTRDALRSLVEADAQLDDDDPNDAERGFAGDDTFQVDAHVEELVDGKWTLNLVISRLY
jgi:hypothetical protein